MSQSEEDLESESDKKQQPCDNDMSDLVVALQPSKEIENMPNLRKLPLWGKEKEK